MRVAVVGHVEWVEFARVEHMPASGEIVHAVDAWEEPAGGGAVAAVQLLKLAGSVVFYTALGDDVLGRRARCELEAMGVRVEAALPERAATPRADSHRPQRGAHDHRDRRADGAEIGAIRFRGTISPAATPSTSPAATRKPSVPRGGRGCSSPRRVGSRPLAASGVELDALVGSATDPGERYRRGDLEPPPRVVVRTAGGEGGTYERRDGSGGSYPAAPAPGPVVDTYGCGDSFAAGLTYALGAGRSPRRGARARGPLRCGMPDGPRRLRRPAQPVAAAE